MLRLIFVSTLVLCLLSTLFGLNPVVASAASPPPPSLSNDALVAPPPSSAGLATASRGPSQFMAGRVAIWLLLPESNGAREASTEEWSAEEVALVQTQVQAALDWWSARLPLARLSFSLHTDVVPMAYEPISHGLADEGLWIGATLSQLGFGGTNYFDQAYAAVEARRSADQADWSSLIFVADSSTSPANAFNDDRFAYAYVGGPLMVLSSDVGGYGSSQMAPIVAHELGHIFEALDQYPGAGVSCTQTSGYLDAPTSNSRFGDCGPGLASIMLDPNSAFAAGQVDASALAQVGYRDSDQDGLIDPLDTTPSVALSAGGQVAGSAHPLLSGQVIDQPLSTASQQPVSINTISQVELRIDNGPWQPVPPADRAYDSAEEAFSLELPLYDGEYRLEVRALNSAGVYSTPSLRQLSVAGAGAAPAYRPTAPAFSNSRQISLDLAAAQPALAVQIADAASLAEASWQPYAAQLSYTLGAGDGLHTLYVRFRDSAGLVSPFYPLEVVLDTQAPVGSAVRDPQQAGLLRLAASDSTSAVTTVEWRIGSGAAQQAPFSATLNLGDAALGQPVSLRFGDAADNFSTALSVPGGYTTLLPLVIF